MVNEAWSEGTEIVADFSSAIDDFSVTPFGEESLDSLLQAISSDRPEANNNKKLRFINIVFIFN